MDGVVSRTGGARIGWVNATWPLASFEASAQHLSLSVGILGKYSFSPEEIVALEPQGTSRFFSSAIHIIHTNPEFPKTLTFFCAGSALALVDEIRAAGFRPGARHDQIPVRSGPPFRWTFLIAVIVIWNLLFMLDGFVPWNLGRQEPGPGALLALGMLFVVSSSLTHSAWLQTLAVKPGRSVAESKSFLLLIRLISGILIVAFLLAPRW